MVALTVAAVAIAVTAGHLPLWAVLVVAAGLGCCAGPIIARHCCRGSVSVTYRPGFYEDLKPNEEPALEVVRGKPVRVQINGGPACGGLIAGRFIRSSGGAAAIHLLLLPVVFAGAGLIVLLWPGVENLGLGYWSGAVGLTALGMALYLCFGWAATVSLARPLQPVAWGNRGGL